MLITFFTSLNQALIKIFSLPLLVRTFFKPWKNEYREGLVGFSIGMGMFIKTFAIVANLVIILGFLVGEIVFSILFLLWPSLLILWMLS